MYSLDYLDSLLRSRCEMSSQTSGKLLDLLRFKLTLIMPDLFRESTIGEYGRIFASANISAGTFILTPSPFAPLYPIRR